MKNLKFVVALLMLSTLGTAAQAASVTPQNHASRMPFSSPGGASGVLQKIQSPQFPAPLASRFVATRPETVAEIPIDNFLRFVSLRNAFHYLDGEGESGQRLPVQTKLTQQRARAEDVTEPASEVLMLAALSALAIAIRRRSPS